MVKSVRVRRSDIPEASYRCKPGEGLYIDAAGVLWVLKK